MSSSKRAALCSSASALLGAAVPKKNPVKAASSKNTLDPTLPSSWIEIHPDNTILIRTGKSDFGQSTTFTAYRQIVAEELNAPFEAITTVVMGDTDRTPDGSGAFDFLGRGTPNIRKAAAYTYQALLDLASQRLGVPKRRAFREGRRRFGRRQEHVVRRTGEGPAVEAHDSREGRPDQHHGIDRHRQSAHEARQPIHHHRQVLSRTASSRPKSPRARQWATDVRLPGMLHARMVHPKTLGSTLVSVGELDKTKFPNAQVVVKGNLVGVVAPTEWEAIRAAQQVASATKWTDWKGLPGNANLFEHLQKDADWKTTQVTKSDKSRGDVRAGAGGAAKKLSATYEFPFMKHAPIGPTMAVADVRADGTVHIYTHNQNPQALRGEIAQMLGITIDHVVVRTFAGPGHYGRSNGGNAGAEDEAVILSKAVGRPVRVQWMRPDDFQWSTQSPAAFSDVEIGLDANGKMIGVSDRPLHARHAGRPAGGRGARRSADHGRSEREGRVHRLDGQRHFRSLDLRRRRRI